jgi:chromosome partitioning protein
MKVIVVASRKGGVGKSTITANLSVAAGQKPSNKVAVVDLDPQASVTHWSQIRRVPSPLVHTSTAKKLSSLLSDLKAQGFTHVIVDMPPYDKEWVAEVMSQANLIVVPTKASPLDLHSVSATLESLSEAKKPMVWVINGASSRANIADTVALELAKFAPVCKQKLHERSDYVLSMGEGRSVLEAKPKGKSAQEITALWKFVESKL